MIHPLVSMKEKVLEFDFLCANANFGLVVVIEERLRGNQNHKDLFFGDHVNQKQRYLAPKVLDKQLGQKQKCICR